jgi:pyruvate/2-oxoglutarate dehydrogenase complex dihydrolipoamide acyltransferase (E2) component
VAIVTMERAVKRPVVVEGDAIAIRWMLNVCLSFDHRALDGHEAGAFLHTLKERLEAWEP